MTDSKKTVVVGASPNPSRYAYRAAHMLSRFGHEFIPLSIKRGSVAGEEIMDLREKPVISEIDTLTLYIGPQHHEEWMDYWLSLSPKRIIFNPGTENPEFMEKAKAQGIEVVSGCTLVMLQTGIY
ncbi:CoA-binding protein [Catalinimonas sp. 4WD22]|uniref:CoA-binding protein n=1 Tax=Catalinimonas locisalis TaxID=3133978 RepID=UPI0031019518